MSAHPQAPVSAKPGRPFGVYIIILLLLLIAGLNVLSLLGYIAVVNTGAILVQSNDTLTAIYAGILVATTVVLSIGLWFLRRWAWLATIVIISVLLGIEIWSYYQGEQPYITLLLGTFAVFYLNLREVQRAFGGRKAEVSGE